MNRRKITLISIAAALAALLVGGSFAFYVTSERTHNVITSGGVEIQLFEDTDQVGNDGRPLPFQDIVNATPGQSYSKIPRVQNVDDGAAWVRIKPTSEAKLIDNSIIAVENIFTININSRYWLDGGDGYYYYYRALQKSETTEPFFTTVSLKDNLENIYKGATFGLKLKAQAVQQKNNGTNVYSAQGWPEE